VRELIAAHYEQVLIYGERAVFDPVHAYEFPRELAKKTQFSGYVFSPENPMALQNFDWPFPPRERRSRPVVLGTCGGGEDGFRTLETFMRASLGAPWQAVTVAGPMTPDAELERLEGIAAETGATFRHYIPHLSALFGSVDALVAMGGYNTLVEAAALGVPTVCVPRTCPRMEQLMRAEAFERLGLLQLCHPERLEAQQLRSHIDRALNISKTTLKARAHRVLDFDGARRAASCLLALAQGTGNSPSIRIAKSTRVSAATPGTN
jgi:predicted glycosyltransferase